VSQLLVRAAGRYGQSRVYDPAARADAGPEIATSIVIDTAMTRFFVVMALFPLLCHHPDYRRCASGHRNASLDHASDYKRGIGIAPA
jgi:hypothetical protein